MTANAADIKSRRDRPRVGEANRPIGRGIQPAAAGFSLCSDLLTGHGSPCWDLQEITKNSTKNIAKS